MYVTVPTQDRHLDMLALSWPLTPKSPILRRPLDDSSRLDGLMSLHATSTKHHRITAATARDLTAAHVAASAPRLDCQPAAPCCSPAPPPWVGLATASSLLQRHDRHTCARRKQGSSFVRSLPGSFAQARPPGSCRPAATPGAASAPPVNDAQLVVQVRQARKHLTRNLSQEWLSQRRACLRAYAHEPRSSRPALPHQP